MTKLELRKVLMIITTAIIFVACGNGNQKFDKNFILENQEYKIWQFKRDSINESSRFGYFYFDNEFNCYNIILNYSIGRFEKFYYDDVIVENKWKINGDTLFIEMLPYLILNKDNDTIFLEFVFHCGDYGRKCFLIDAGLPPVINNSRWDNFPD